MFLILFIIIFLAFFIFKFKPKNSERIYEVVIAHRGFHLFAPENSLGAYKAAIDAGLSIELDIRQTKDGKIVCFHDAYTKRLLNIPGMLSMFNYDDIKSYKILGSDYTVPKFEDVLRLVDGKVELLV